MADSAVISGFAIFGSMVICPEAEPAGAVAEVWPDDEDPKGPEAPEAPWVLSADGCVAVVVSPDDVWLEPDWLTEPPGPIVLMLSVELRPVPAL